MATSTLLQTWLKRRPAQRGRYATCHAMRRCQHQKSGDANKADYTVNNGKERFALAVQHQGEGEQAIGAR